MEDDYFYCESWTPDDGEAVSFIEFQNTTIEKGMVFKFNNPPFKYYDSSVFISFVLVDVNITKFGETVIKKEKYSFEVKFTATDLSFLYVETKASNEVDPFIVETKITTPDIQGNFAIDFD